MNKYTIKDFKLEFPDEKSCLYYIFNKKYPKLGFEYYPVKGRKSFSNSAGKHIYPLKGTIFEKTSTPLTLWFYAIFLFSTSKNGVSAMELKRQLGVTYKTAWRMATQIRKLMEQDSDKLSGIVEADETYYGGHKKHGQGGKGKTPILGIVQRGGGIKAKVAPRETHIILEHIKDNVERGTAVMTDQFGVYKKALKLGYAHESINHWKKEFARNNVHTNTIEGFWSQLKRSISGTFHSVSVKYLQTYVNQFAFLYSNREQPVFRLILARI